MSPHPKTLGPVRQFARHVLPLRLRSAFVRAVDRLAWRSRQPGEHHRHTAARVPGRHAQPTPLPMPEPVRPDVF